MVNENKSTCYCINLRRSAGILTDIYDKALAPCGMTVAQYCLLIHLHRMGNANITQWADQVGLERSTMVRNVRILEKNGWIQPAAGRGRHFTLSPAGQERLTAAIPIWQQTQAAIEQQLGAEDAQALLRIADKLRHFL